MLGAKAEDLEVPDVLMRALPVIVRKARQYFGSFIRLDSGAPGGRELELCVYLADWRLFAKREVLADSEGLAVMNNPHLALLEGASLQQLVVKDANELWLLFDRGMGLQLLANLDEYEPEDELLIAYLDDALVTFSPVEGFVVRPPARREQ